MIILGLDPGTATTGFAVIEKIKHNYKILDFGVISTSKKLNTQTRLKQLSLDLNDLIKKYKPVLFGVEKLFFTTNQKTAIEVAQARGVILLAVAQNKGDLMEFTPLQVKNRICGYGKADKKQVQRAVQLTLKLKSIPKPDDAADALAIALCAGYCVK